jgi:hypothetical protein
MRVLIACEFSGVVRDAFAARGHDAWSCDLLPSERQGWHIKGNVLNELIQMPLSNLNKWDLIIAHPPCTYLCNSGVRWLVPNGKTDRQRFYKMQDACDFFSALYWSRCERVCIENPVMHKYAREYLSWKRRVPSYTQTIQPYEHGHGETKRTGLWLRGLPPLEPSNIVAGRTPRVHHASPGADRWKERSRTLPGVANAMADQWGNLK